MAAAQKDGLTPALRQALRALFQAGDGAIQRRGVLASGEWLPFDGRTWLRLASAGFVEIANGRIAPTDKGRIRASQLPHWEPAE